MHPELHPTLLSEWSRPEGDRRSFVSPLGRTSLLNSSTSKLITLTLISSFSIGAAFSATSVKQSLPGKLPFVAKAAPVKKMAAAPRAQDTFTPVPARRVRLDFVDADVQEVFRALAAQTRSNIVVSPDVKGMITASLRGMSVEEALDAVSRMAGVAYRRIDDTYYVAPKNRLDEMFAAPAVTQTYTVRSADPAELAAVVKAAIPTLTEATSAGRTLVVVKGPREAVEKALALLPSLDVDTTPEAPRTVTRIRELKHIDPATTINTLAELFGQSGLKITAAPSLFFPATQISGGTSAGGGGGGGGSSSGGGGGGGGGGGTGGLSTMLSTRILLTGPDDLVTRAYEMIDQLDVAPPQFEIEARILDISTNRLAQRGVTWNYTNSVTFSEQGAGNTAFTPVSPALQVGTLARVSPFNLQATIAAAITSGDARVLAEPRVRVIEGRSARIFIGDTITAVVNIDRNALTGTSQVTTKEYTPGITLLVAGRSTPEGDITLDVKPTVSFLTSLTTPGIDFPVPQFRERSAQTTIRMRDGETMVLGGLIQDEDIKNMTKVPILGDLPFFGNLFRSRNTTKRRSEVVLFLTARLLRS